MFEEPPPPKTPKFLPDVPPPAAWTLAEVIRAALGLAVIVILLWVAIAILT